MFLRPLSQNKREEVEQTLVLRRYGKLEREIEGTDGE